jgi:hypothetical protein
MADFVENSPEIAMHENQKILGQMYSFDVVNNSPL